MKIDVETLVCALREHVIPARTVAELEPEDAGYGMDLHPTWRLSRCLRCDAWIGGPPPTTPRRQRLAELQDHEFPRRGKELRQAVILRLISVERAVHAVAFTAIAVLGLLLRSHLAGFQSSLRRYLDTLTSTEGQTGRSTHGLVTREGTKFLHLSSGTLEVLIITAAVYAIVEGTEAVGLWYEKRWAEYLTAVATAGFIPFEIHELMKKLTVVRVGALVVNLAILIYLVFAKHLFGVGHARGEGGQSKSSVDRSVFSPPF